MLPYDEDDWEGDDEDVDEPPVVVEGQLSVVSRWDLAVADSDALMAADRAAHRRMRSEETQEDAVAAVWNLGVALYSIAHEMPVPWHDLDGVVGACGTVATSSPTSRSLPPPGGGGCRPRGAPRGSQRRRRVPGDLVVKHAAVGQCGSLVS